MTTDAEKEQDHQNELATLREVTRKIDIALVRLNALAHPTRESALTRTKLQEAKMWAVEDFNARAARELAARG